MADSGGLDKDNRLAGKRAADALAAIPPPLDPDFPYTAEPLDVEFFNIPADPSKAAVNP